MNSLLPFLLFLKGNVTFLHNTLEQEAGEGVKKNIKYCGTETARVGSTDFFFVVFLFSREKANTPRFAEPQQDEKREKVLQGRKKL